jgi:hypothetical protein
MKNCPKVDQRKAKEKKSFIKPSIEGFGLILVWEYVKIF